MTSASIQSTAPTIPGQRYVLCIANLSAEIIGPSVTFSVNGGISGFCELKLQGEDTGFEWAAGEIKWLEFPAWGDSIKLNSTLETVFWRLLPIP